jgi:diguanylate cyclase (GGDEF)-like protein
MASKERAAPSANGGESGEDRSKQRSLVDATLADGDQTLADLDQTLSDTDQSLSDTDQARSDRDQTSSDRDQLASDLEQAAADRTHSHADDDEDVDEEEAIAAAAGVYREARANRLRATDERLATAAERARTAAERLGAAQTRDLTAQARDLAAAERDRAAEALEALAAGPDAKSSAERRLVALRARAAQERARAADDRAAAATDRAAAAGDRADAAAELRHAYHDELTGALRREMGEVALQHEVDRARRGDGRLVLAFVDVDALKSVNDSGGHSAGDALLRGVVATMRAKLRSFDPVVRYGGDEFVCALSGTDPADASARFAEIKKTLSREYDHAGISVGVVELRPDETLDDLVIRGDAALYEAKRNGR